jgi:hypothetical protein
MTYDSMTVLLMLKIQEQLELTAQRWRDVLLSLNLPTRKESREEVSLFLSELSRPHYENVKYERINIIHLYYVNIASALLS